MEAAGGSETFLHSVTSQKNVILLLTAVITPDLVFPFLLCDFKTWSRPLMEQHSNLGKGKVVPVLN
jgi:hypothetical protein